MVVKRCCAYGCKAKSGGSPKFVSFPECRKRSREWLQALNRPDILADISNDKHCLLNFYYVCDAHFSKNKESKETPVLLVASKGSCTEKTTNMESSGTCTDRTNMQESGTCTDKTNMHNKGTCTEYTKTKNTGTSTTDLSIERLIVSPVYIIEIPPAAEPVASCPKPEETIAPSPGVTEHNTRLADCPKPEETNAPSPAVTELNTRLADCPKTRETIAPSLRVTELNTKLPSLPTDSANAKPIAASLKGIIPATNAESPVGNNAEPNAIKSTPNVRKQGLKNTPPGKLDDIWKNSVQSYNKRKRRTKGKPTNTPRSDHTVAHDAWEDSVHPHDTLVRPPTWAVIHHKLEQLEANKLKNSKPDDTGIRPTTKLVPPSPGYMVPDISNNYVKSNHPQNQKTTTSLRSFRKKLPTISVKKLHTDSNESNLVPVVETNDVTNITETNLPEIKMEVTSVDSQITIEEHPLAEDEVSERERIKTPEIKNEPTGEDTEITIEEHPLVTHDLNTILEPERNTLQIKKEPTSDDTEITIEEHSVADNLNTILESERKTPEIKNEPTSEDTEITLEEHPLVADDLTISDSEKIKTPEIRTEESTLGLDDVFKAISEREKNRRTEPLNAPNITFKLQMNLPALEQALLLGNVTDTRSGSEDDVYKNIRTYKRKRIE